MKFWTFAKRNILEYLRSPIVLFFTLAFPVLMFLVFQIIKLGTGVTDDMVPMFNANNLTASISVFSYSFVSLSLSTQIAKDRESSFQARLSVSPLTSIDLFFGYLVPALFIAIFQTALSFILGIIFGLTLSLWLILAFIMLIVISTFYISIGLILGSLLAEKACSGISSIIVNATALFSGMFFPLSDGTFKSVLTYFPFLPSTAIPQAFITENYQDIWLYFVVFAVYLIISIALGIYLFGKKLKNK